MYVCMYIRYMYVYKYMYVHINVQVCISPYANEAGSVATRFTLPGPSNLS